MGKPKIEVPDPMPSCCPAKQNGRKSDNHERDIRRVDHGYEIGCRQPEHCIVVFTLPVGQFETVSYKETFAASLRNTEAES